MLQNHRSPDLLRSFLGAGSLGNLLGYVDDFQSGKHLPQPLVSQMARNRLVRESADEDGQLRRE